jgi:hypothetical protein
MTDTVSKSASKRKPPPKGGSRKGIPNKVTADIKSMILGALHSADPKGGQEYLKKQAQANPVAFMGLLGKVIPSEIKADVKGSMTINFITDFPE